MQGPPPPPPQQLFLNLHPSLRLPVAHLHHIQQGPQQSVNFGCSSGHPNSANPQSPHPQNDPHRQRYRRGTETSGLEQELLATRGELQELRAAVQALTVAFEAFTAASAPAPFSQSRGRGRGRGKNRRGGNSRLG